MPEPIISASGIRGIVGESFTPQVVLRAVTAFASVIRGGGRVMIARDTRPSGEMAFHAAVAGFTASGIDVLNLGVIPTPTALFCSAQKELDGGIVITASHNPAEWNGMELSGRSGSLLTGEQKSRFMEAYYSRASKMVGWDEVGILESYENAVEDHIGRILSLDWIDAERIKSRRLKVVVDCCNGAGSVITPELLRRLGCEVIELFCDPSGRFPRHPEPTAQTLDDLAEEVKRNNADLGIAHDPDADRCVFVSDKGNPLSEEMTFPLATDFLLSRKRGVVATTVVTSMLIDHIARKYDAEVVRTRVGVSNVVEMMNARDAVIGGEGTGGVIFPDVHLTSDGITSTAAIVQMISEREKSLSEIVSGYPRYHIAKMKVRIGRDVNPDEIIESVAANHSDEDLNTIDGVRINYPDGWVCIRKSGTEPVIRVFAESESEVRSEALARLFVEEVERSLK